MDAERHKKADVELSIGKAQSPIISRKTSWG